MIIYSIRNITVEMIGMIKSRREEGKNPDGRRANPEK
jgi:hypothetical protein